MSTKFTRNGLTVNTYDVVSRIHIEHIGEWITRVTEQRAVDRKHVLQEYTFRRCHIAFVQFCRMDSVRRVQNQLFHPNYTNNKCDR